MFYNLEETMITKFLNNRYESDIVKNKAERIINGILRRDMGLMVDSLLVYEVN